MLSVENINKKLAVTAGSKFGFALHHKSKVLLVVKAGRRLHQAQFLEPGVLTARLAGSGSRPGTVGEQQGGSQGHHSGTGDDQEEAQPTKPRLDLLQRLVICNNRHLS